MSQTNVPQRAGNIETVVGGVLAVGIIALIAFCCCGRSSKYDSDYIPSSSGSTNPISNASNLNSTTILKTDANNTTSSAKKAIVITQNANLRKSGSSNSEVIRTMPEGTSVEIINQKGAWFLVKNNGQSGWMHGNTIRFVTSTTENSQTSTSSTSTYEDDITRRRNAECVRQREAFGVDTSPCSEWATER